ncbi:MAG: hypothetical protein HOP10_14905 [Chitinophagaceae bacterium]|nr:hypothetical protein [Chitinophagaceae bacterium]
MRKLFVVFLLFFNSYLFAQNVGIGTATPNMKLHVSSLSDTALLQVDNNAVLANNTNVGMYFKNGSYYTGAIKTTGTGSNVARLGFYTFAIANQNQLLERMSILDNGNVGINTTNPVATLDVNGTVKISGGSPGAGKILTSDATGNASWQNNTSPGAWSLTGNAGTTSANFLGTTDNVPLNFKVNNTLAGQIDQVEDNLSYGYRSLLNNTFAKRNIAVGNNALAVFSYANGGTSYDSYNIAVGDSALFSNQTTVTTTQAARNIAIGHRGLRTNSSGSRNIALGNFALFSSTTANDNLAIGDNALFDNTVGFLNIAIGNKSLTNNTSGFNNLGLGYNSLGNNTAGSFNIAIGEGSMASNTNNDHNIAMGFSALSSQSNTSGVNTFNIAIGDSSLSTNNPGPGNSGGKNNIALGHYSSRKNTTGEDNIALGNLALYSGTTAIQNIAIGNESLYSNNGGFNVAIGFEALNRNTTGTENIAIGRSVLMLNTTGLANIAIGSVSQLSSTLGSYNITMGIATAYNNTTASHNIAIGTNSLYNQSFSNAGVAYNSWNMAIGDSALFSNNPTSLANGFGNTAAGHMAMRDNTTGFQNTAIGYSAMANNTTGRDNTIIGADAFDLATSGSFNTATGRAALGNSASATDNTAIGYGTLFNSTGSGNTALGISAGDAVTTGTFNTFIGRNTDVGVGASGITNASAIGNEATVNASNTMVFGNNSVNKWGFGVNTSAANILEFNNAITTARLTIGGVWTNASDRNLKNNFSELNKKDLLNRIMQLPVTRWSYIKENTMITHIGPMAQDFYQLFKTGGDDKTISSIDPAGVALAGIQQLKTEVDELKAEITALKKLIASLQNHQ